MDFIELALDILKQIQANGAVRNWATATYGRDLKYFVGVGGTSATAPTENDVPFVIVTEGSVTRSIAGGAGSATVVLGWDVTAQGQTEIDGIKVLSGSVTSNDLGELIADAIPKVTAYYTVDSIEIEPATTEEWGPRFPGLMTISLTLR